MRAQSTSKHFHPHLCACSKWLICVLVHLLENSMSISLGGLCPWAPPLTDPTTESEDGAALIRVAALFAELQPRQLGSSYQSTRLELYWHARRRWPSRGDWDHNVWCWRTARSASELDSRRHLSLTGVSEKPSAHTKSSRRLMGKSTAVRVRFHSISRLITGYVSYMTHTRHCRISCFQFPHQ